MIARGALLGFLLLSAIAAFAQRLVLEPEEMLGSRELGATWNSSVAPAIATDGDELFVLYRSGSELHTARFDRDGKLLAPPATLRYASGLAWDTPLRVVWLDGFYRVFLLDAAFGRLHVLRVTRDGDVLADTVLAQPLARALFEVATDGREIVLATTDAILRFGSDDALLATIPLAASGWYGPPRRAVAFGGDAFAILTADETSITTRFLRDGVLGDPIVVSRAGNGEMRRTAITWTGTTFVAAWVDCMHTEYADPCLAQWTPLTSRGDAAGLIRVVDQFNAPSYERPSIDIAAIDDETVLLTWSRTERGIAQVQRVRVSGTATGARSQIELPLASVRTASGALAVIDGSLRIAMTHGGDVEPLPFATGVPRLQREGLLAMATSRNALAVARVTYRDGALLGAITVSILAPDGTLLREVALPGQTQTSLERFAMTSDGDEFFAIAAGSDGVWFHRLADPLHPVRLTDNQTWGIRMKLAWSGTDLVASWQYGERARVLHLDRNGTRLADSFDDAYFLQDLHALGGRTLLGWIDKANYAQVAVLDERGDVKDSDSVFRGAYTYELALASNGPAEACIAVTNGQRKVAFASRRAGGSFVETPTLHTSAQYEQLRSLSLVPFGDAFAAAWQTDTAPHVHLAVVSEDGAVPVAKSFGSDAWAPQLASLNDQLFVAYTRSIDAQPFDGITRVFLRRVSVGDERERSTPDEDRRK